jgi:phospholipid/cholesterol/gamma-HCH transport system permease protein
MGALTTGLVSTQDFIYGIQYDFRPFLIIYTLSKTLVFAFIITSVSAYEGFFTKGGSLEVGKASTRAVVNSSVLILLFNVILTQLMLI